MKRKMVAAMLLCLALMVSWCEGVGAAVEIPTFQQWNSYSETEQIKKVQERLITLGYLYGNADGINGNQTKSAIIKYKTYSERAIKAHVSINDNITYGLYSMLCKESTMAHSEYALAANTYNLWQYVIEGYDERGFIYDGLVADLSTYKRLKKEGRTGTKQYAEIKDVLFPEGYDEDAYLKVLEKYFTSDAWGRWRFIESIAERTDGQIIEIEGNGYTLYNGEYQVNQKICMVSELAVGHVEALLGKMADGFDEYKENLWPNSWSDEVKREVDAAHGIE